MKFFYDLIFFKYFQYTRDGLCRDFCAASHAEYTKNEKNISACDKDTDGRAHSAELSAAIKDDLAVATPHNPLIVIKHHLYTNFTAYGLEEPTWINVAREPVSRFVSSYYFRRFGFARHEGVRNNRVKAGERAMEMVRYLTTFLTKSMTNYV